MSQSKTTAVADLENRVDQYNSEYEKGEKSWFDFFADAATIYVIGSAEPFPDRASYERNFAPMLKESRKVDVLKRDVAILDGTGIVMQLVEVTQTDVATIFRESTIWTKDNGAWKIIHLHTSLAATPRATDTPRDAHSIKVIADRIATVSSQVGITQ
jgi:hypothetical protein